MHPNLNCMLMVMTTLADVRTVISKKMRTKVYMMLDNRLDVRGVSLYSHWMTNIFGLVTESSPAGSPVG